MNLRSYPIAAAAVCGATIAGAAQAADETNLSALVNSAQFTTNLAGANLGLENQAVLKTFDARKLRVTGNNPQWVVEGTVSCRPGAKLTKVQAFTGNVVNNNGELYPLGVWSSSATDTSVAGQSSANVSLPLTLPVSRSYNNEAVDLTFNPARVFELKLKSFVANGGSGAGYLQTSEAFDMEIPIVLAAWCRMDDNGSLLAGETRGGYVRRVVKATILYNGDPAVVDGIGVRAATPANRGQVAAPQPETPRVRAPTRGN